MRDMTEREIAAHELLRLLAPALSEGRGMAARDRELRFLAALETLVGPLGPKDDPIHDRD